MAPHLGRPTGTRERQVPQNNGVKRKLTGERGLERDECHCDVWTGAGKFGVVRPALCLPEPGGMCGEPCILPACLAVIAARLQAEMKVSF